MKNNLVKFVLLLFIPVVVISCEPDLKLTADWKDVTIIHGFVTEGFMFYGGMVVRVKKAFSGEENAYDMASRKDTTIYTDEPIEVTVQEIFNGYTVEYPMTPYIYERDSVLFSVEDNLWWIEDEGVLSYDSRKEYKVIVYFPERDKYVTAKTHVIPKITLARPNINNRILHLTDPDYPYTIIYYSAAYAEYYRIRIVFSYVDMYADSVMVDQNLTWDLDPQIVTPAPSLEDAKRTLKQTLSYQGVYGYVASHIPNDNAVIYRKLKSLKVRLFASTHEYNLYYNSGKDFQFGSSRKPYTNVVNGEGIFTSFSWNEVDSLLPDQASLDSLAYGELTHHLKFKNMVLRHEK